VKLRYVGALALLHQVRLHPAQAGHDRARPLTKWLIGRVVRAVN
jgi:hypothetical protein